jgi:hypothetical protein
MMDYNSLADIVDLILSWSGCSFSWIKDVDEMALNDLTLQRRFAGAAMSLRKGAGSARSA